MTKEKLMEIVGSNLRFYRAKRHMTQEELAEKVGVSISFCANIERGKKGVSMFVLRDFADALEITVNQLLYDCNANQHIDNIMVLLQGKSTAYLSWLEQVISIPYDALPNSK